MRSARRRCPPGGGAALHQGRTQRRRGEGGGSGGGGEGSSGNGDGGGGRSSAGIAPRRAAPRAAQCFDEHPRQAAGGRWRHRQRARWAAQLSTIAVSDPLQILSAEWLLLQPRLRLIIFAQRLLYLPLLPLRPSPLAPPPRAQPSNPAATAPDAHRCAATTVADARCLFATAAIGPLHILVIGESSLRRHAAARVTGGAQLGRAARAPGRDVGVVCVHDADRNWRGLDRRKSCLVERDHNGRLSSGVDLPRHRLARRLHVIWR